MKAIDNLRAQLEAVGAKLDYDEGAAAFYCDATPGYEWEGNGCTVICEQFQNVSGQRWIKQAIASAMDTLKFGLRKVTDEADIEEYRHLKDDDSWGAPADAPDFIAFPKA